MFRLICTISWKAIQWIKLSGIFHQIQTPSFLDLSQNTSCSTNKQWHSDTRIQKCIFKVWKASRPWCVPFQSDPGMRERWDLPRSALQYPSSTVPAWIFRGNQVVGFSGWDAVCSDKLTVSPENPLRIWVRPERRWRDWREKKKERFRWHGVTWGGHIMKGSTPSSICNAQDVLFTIACACVWVWIHPNGWFDSTHFAIVCGYGYSFLWNRIALYKLNLHILNMAIVMSEALVR